MEKKGEINTNWQQRYFILKPQILYYCKIGNENLLKKHKKIDLHDIECIYQIPKNCRYVENDKIYFEFRLKQKGRIWKLRVETENARILWTDCLLREFNKLQLTLVRYKEILSEINLHESIKDYFVSRQYTIFNVMDDHIHVMRYHNNVDFINTFKLINCNKDSCSSWHRFISKRNDRLLYDNDDDDDMSNFYFNTHDEENCLQNIFDNIHCYIFHTIDRRLKHQSFKRINNKERSEHEIDEKDDSDDEGGYGDYNKKEELMVSHHTRRKSSVHTKDISFHESFDGKYKHYNKQKYLYKNEPFPGEYECGLKMTYHEEGPGHKCLKHEIAAWVDEENFKMYLEVCKYIVQTKEAEQHSSNANNDHYQMRFGGAMGIEHALCLYLYCAVDPLCTELRKTYRVSGNDRKYDENYIKWQHYQRFYWFGRFLYEGMVKYICF